MPGRIRNTQPAIAEPRRDPKAAIAKRLPFTRDDLQSFVFYDRPKNITFRYEPTPPPADQIARSVNISRHDDHGHTMTAHVLKDGSLFLEDHHQFAVLGDASRGISVWNRAVFTATGAPIAVAEAK